MMRTVLSDVAGTDVSAEYAEQVTALIDALSARGAAEYETTQVNRHGQTDYYVRVCSFEAPGSGETLWAVDYSDPAVRELEETGSREEAVARYVELVRAGAKNLGVNGEGFPERFTTTDVDGVPGPLPDLPDVSPDEVVDLLDTDGTPVLYLARDEDGDPVLHIGQADHVDSDVTVLTRSGVLGALGLADGDSRVDSDYAARKVYPFGLAAGRICDETGTSVRHAAEVLFPVPAA